MRVFCLDLLTGKRAQRGGVPGRAAGLTLAPSVSFPAARGAPNPAASTTRLRAGSRNIQLPETAGLGSFTQPHLEPGLEPGGGSRQPSPLVGGNSKHTGTSGLCNREAGPPGQRMLVNAAAGQGLVNRFPSGVSPVHKHVEWVGWKPQVPSCCHCHSGDSFPVWCLFKALWGQGNTSA